MAQVLSPEQLDSRMSLSKLVRQQLEDEALLDEQKDNSQTTLWKSIQGFIPNIHLRYTISSNPMILFEIDMHDLWFRLLLAGKVTDADDAGQDRLVALILSARELGTMTRSTTVSEGEKEEEAITEEGGKIWKDLPYCVRDFREEWMNSMNLSSKRRTNLAALTARMVSVGVCGDKLTANAIWLFRETLEVPRRLTSKDSGEEVPIEELLPACVAWLKQCGSKLVKLAFIKHSFPMLDSRFVEPGELARNAKIEDLGFSVERWVFWRQKLKDIGRCEDSELADLAQGTYSRMIGEGSRVGVKIPGEVEYDERIKRFMDEKFKKLGDDEPKMVTSEGFSIYSDEDE